MSKKHNLTKDALFTTSDSSVGKLIFCCTLQLYIFNKIDCPNTVNKDELQQRFASFNPQFISTINREGYPKLVDAIQNEICKLLL